MNIVISMEMTRQLRNTWHAALNHEWYDFLHGHMIVPVCCHGPVPELSAVDLVILTGGNDMFDIRTWRDNHYPQRDLFEKQLLDQAVQSQTPVVGICRGFHFINWARGGTHKLMADPYDNRVVNLNFGSVTCHHTIEIEHLAPEFEVLEQDPTGVIELALDKKHHLLGVGWHPERAVNQHTRGRILDLISNLVRGS